MTELAREMSEDNQCVRALWNYLMATANDLVKGGFEWDEFNDEGFKNEYEFYQFVSDIALSVKDARREIELTESN